MIEIDSKVSSLPEKKLNGFCWFLTFYLPLRPRFHVILKLVKCQNLNLFWCHLGGKHFCSYLIISDHKHPVTAIIILRSTTHLRPWPTHPRPPPPTYDHNHQTTHLSIPLDGLASLIEDGDVVRGVVAAQQHRHLDLPPELRPARRVNVNLFWLEKSPSF